MGDQFLNLSRPLNFPSLTWGGPPVPVIQGLSYGAFHKLHMHLVGGGSSLPYIPIAYYMHTQGGGGGGGPDSM